MIRERIKTETAQNHKDVEAVGYSGQIMSGALSLGEYKKLILTNLILNKSFEQQWDSLTFDVPEELMLAHRKKAESLEKDASMLGIPLPETYTLSFPVGNFASFMGALYVFEGSTLGGSIIHKQLKVNDNLSHLDGFHFYSCYGERLGMMWKIFLDHLTQIEDTGSIDSAIEAAKTTFNLTQEAFIKVTQASS
jgi:heme oxygenase